MALPLSELHRRARRLRLLLLDVDGVLTDGTVVISTSGHEAKSFSIRDGAGIVYAQRAGLEVALLSGRPSEATTRRAAELGIRTVVQGGPDKRTLFQKLLADKELEAADVACMGDDLLDLPVLLTAGVSAAPADAVEDVRSRVHWVSQARGGHGAVREYIELLLKARGVWDTELARYLD